MAKKKPQGNLCNWCEKEYTDDTDYWRCQKCLDKLAKEQQTHTVYHLPGNP